MSLKKKVAMICLGVAVSVAGLVAADGSITDRIRDQGTIICAAEENSPKEYTVMLYMVGSDLEEDNQAATRDIYEIEEVMRHSGLSDSVNVVAEVGGSDSWEHEKLKDISTARVTIDKGGLQVQEKMSNINMGKSSSVTSFIEYARNDYPAEHYMLLFWNHGEGPTKGFGSDALHNRDSLLLSEMKQALEESVIRKFDLIGFDACNMGNIETANVIYGHADYMVASSASEDENGWDYRWLKILEQHPGKTVEIARRIIDCYLESSNERMKEKGIATLSCYDMERYSELQKGIEIFGIKVLAYLEPSMCEKLSEMRSGIPGYYSGGMLMQDMELLDFQMLFHNLEPGVWDNLQMEEKLNKFVCYSCQKGVPEGMSGISIYLPAKSDLQLAKHLKQYFSCSFDERYINFVHNYARTLRKEIDLELERLDKEDTPVSEKIELFLTDEQIANDGKIYLMTALPIEGSEACFLLSTDSDVERKSDDRVIADVDSEYVTIGGQLLCLIEQCHTDEFTDYVSPIEFNGERCIMTIRFSRKAVNGEIVSIIPCREDERAVKAQYTLEAGVKFCPLYPIINKEYQGHREELMSWDDYYKGEPKELRSFECQLRIRNVDIYQCLYGLMVKDHSLENHYSGLRKIELG